MSRDFNVVFSKDDDFICFIDWYLKRAMINMKIRFARILGKTKNISLFPLETERYIDEDEEWEKAYNSVTEQLIEAANVKVLIQDPYLAEALMCLSEKQRSILLQSVVLGRPMQEIADSFGISRQMAHKYKCKAIVLVKNIMEVLNEQERKSYFTTDGIGAGYLKRCAGC